MRGALQRDKFALQITPNVRESECRPLVREEIRVVINPIRENAETKVHNRVDLREDILANRIILIEELNQLGINENRFLDDHFQEYRLRKLVDYVLLDSIQNESTVLHGGCRRCC